MFCPNCGKQIPEDSRFCPACGKEHTPARSGPASPAPAKSAHTITLNAKTLLMIAAALVIVILLAVLVFRPRQSAEQTRGDSPRSEKVHTAAPTPSPTPDPAAALVGTWTNRDGVGLTFTSGGSLRLSGFGFSLGGDTFKYEIQDENTLYLTADNALGLGFTAPYAIVGDTLYIEISGYALELTKK